MARHVEVSLIDDIDGSPAERTVTFGLDGDTYEIDLGAENLQRLTSALEPYISNGRKAARRTTRRGGGSASRSSSKASEVRQWARSQGMTVADRGSVPQDIIDAYNQAH